MRRRLRWWWWAAAVLTGILLISIPASFTWIFGWTDAGCRYYLYLEHGMLCGNPNAVPPGTLAPSLPWYGHFQIYRSPIYEPWRALPQFDFSGPGSWRFKFPMHLGLVVLIPVLVLPLLPGTIRRERRKRGLCVKCGYDLTGNVSGRCPECGEAV